MKNIKKIISLITALVLTLGISTTAFASDINSNIGRVSDMSIEEVVAYLETNGGSVDSSFLDICENIEEMKSMGVDDTVILENIESMPSTYSVYDQWGSLSNSEKLLVVTYPKEAIAIQSNASKASNSAKSVYGNNGNGDKSDAYRHGYWNALNARDVGKSIAEAFATAHEDISDEELNKVYNGYYGWQHRSMDLHNNEVGRGVVNWNDWFTSDSTMSSRIVEQINKGNMVILVKCL